MPEFTENHAALGPDLLCLIEGLDETLVGVEELTRLKRSDSSRASFRLSFADGSVLKGRRFASEEQRVVSNSLLEKNAGLPFSPVMGSRGIATIEKWVDGSTPAPAGMTDRHLAESAAVLARLHRCQDYPTETPFVPESDTVARERLEHELRSLNSQGQLSGADLPRLIEIAKDNKPGELLTGVIHKDFHPGNMVISKSGELYIIDNEHLQIGFLDFDISRSWSRWPMSEYQRDIFEKSYQEYRSMEDFLAHERFWAVLSLVRTAFIHTRFRQTNQMALDQLHKIADSGGEETWPTDEANRI